MSAKTLPTNVPAEEFVASVEPERRRREGERLLEIFHEVTGAEPVMWGPSIVGYGEYEYRYASGQSGVWPRVGFSPRKAKLALYGLTDHPAVELEPLGPHSTGASCLYVTRLESIDEDALRELIRLGWEHAR
jgi:hypothetical protein